MNNKNINAKEELVFSPERRAGVLVETLPYITRFAGRVVVVKFGGNAMESDELADQFAQDIVLMHSVGIKPVVVHGGGPQIGDLVERLGLSTEFKDGQRVTDKETLEIAQMVLVGKVNTDIVSSINVHSPIAVGLSGGDSKLIEATQRDSSLGYVGDVVKINPSIVDCLMEENLIPVISTIGTDSNGQAYNINSDTVAAALAGSLKAERLLYLTDVEGLLEDVSDPESKISKIGISSLNDLIDKGIVKSGMIPKAQACIDAIKEGVASAHMVDGRIPHVLLLELFTDAGIGTMVLPEDMVDSFKSETHEQDQL
ncbi:MAG: acetylglutamate kinase [Acidimicrobiales bacterium]|jgi:acetylglutamate kinase|nr:acetylglutamate kinase [Acidimicrobiaceae bacterium]MDP6162333.1 acetylglutamate kinase [Acidimicrobiales bacterium]MDP6285501.1 acetylglutamate kinase [Acidimicrobiales bacterium]HJL91819.1 acetylglutamate kinase [Acidimicrobiales bacterium]HJO40626.1 acetylglutamate kinase [Acidimicrobiales bacterium]|tara:strand:+ start:3593 stop:4531 length:939 start_codon:yes stop_codon:yes gene_type:complete